MHRIDYASISNAPNSSRKLEIVDQEISKSLDYICLTDALLNRDRCGELVQTWLLEDEKQNGFSRRYKIRVLRDEWGTAPPELTEVKLSQMRNPKDRAGRNITSRQMNDMARRGTLKKEMYPEKTFKIDEKGCIDCSYSEASIFLSQYGISWETKSAICGRRELSSGPCKAPDGQLKHVWYWRFEEAPPEVYEALPTLTDKPQRGPGRPRASVDQE